MGRAASVLGAALALIAACTRDGSPSRTESLGVARASFGEAVVSADFPVDYPLLRDFHTWGRTELRAGPAGYLATFSLIDDPDSLQRAADVVVTRVSPAGVPLDPVGIELGAGDGPRAVHTGTSWLVVWGRDGELFCGRLLDDGTALDPGGRALGVAGYAWRVSYGGGHALVLGSDGRAFALNPDCRPASYPLTVVPAGVRKWGLEFDGTHFLVTYNTNVVGSADTLVAQRVQTNGALEGDPIVLATASVTRTVEDTEGYHGVEGNVATQAGTTLVAYQQAAWDSVNRVGVPGIPHFRTLEPNGSLGPEHTLTGVTGKFVLAAPAGDGFVLFDKRPSQSFLFAKVRADGTEVARQETVPLPFEYDLHVANLGSELLVSDWSRLFHYGSNLELASGPTAVVKHAANEKRPAVATAGSVRLVAWDEYMVGVYASRVSTNGTILEAEPALVHDATDVIESRATVASNGTNFLVAASLQHSANTTLEVRPVSASGVVGPRTVVTTHAGGVPLVASNGTDYLVVWTAWSSSTGYQVLAKRFSADGILLDTVPMLLGTDAVGSMAVAYDGNHYLLAFSVSAFAAEGPLVIQRLAPNGNVLAREETPWTGRVRGLIGGNGEALLTYVEPSPSQTLVAARIPRWGEAFDTTGRTLTLTADYSGVSSSAWDGRNYWIAWNDVRRGMIGQDSQGAIRGLDLYASRVSADGDVLDPSGILVQQSKAVRNRDPDVALASERGKVFAATVTFDETHGYRSLRIRGRSLATTGGGGDTGGAGGSAGGGGDGGESDDGGRGGRKGGSGGSPSGGSAGTSGEIAGAGGDVGDSGGEGGRDPSTGGQTTRGGSGNGGYSGGGGRMGSGGSNVGGEDTTEVESEPAPRDDCSCRVVGAASSQERPSALGAVGALVLLGACRRRRRARGVS